MSTASSQKPLCSKIDLWNWRQDCAETAYKRFMRQLNSQSYWWRSDTQITTIAIYGPTQSGKTTLILNLLELKTQSLPEIQKVLRGGQSAGKSSTARILRYLRSKNDDWYIGKQAYQNDNDVCEAFRNLRQEMEHKGRNTDISRIDIFIPKKHFENQNNQQNAVIILDLPGTNASNKAEQAYVSSLHKEIREADLVFLVCSINDLGSLTSEIESPKSVLQNWPYNPTKYKVVCTRTFSDNSIKELLKKSPQFNLADLSQYIGDQFALFGAFPHFNQQIYAVDFGDTWNSLQNNHTETSYLETASYLRQAYLQKIQTDIAESSHVISRLYAGFHIADQAKQVLAYEKDRYQACQEKLNKQICDLRTHNNQLNKKKTLLEETLSQIEEDLNQNKSKSSNLQEKLQKQLDQELKNLYSESILKNVQDLKNLQLKILNSYNHLCLQCNQELKNNQFIGIEIPDMLKNPHPDIITISNKLKNYTFDMYWFSDNLKNDKQYLKQAFNQQKDKIVSDLKNSFDQYFKEQKVLLDKERKSIIYQISKCKEQEENNNKKMTALQEQKKTSTKDFNEQEQKLQEDMDYGNQFVHSIEDSYNYFIAQNVMPNFNSEKAATKKLFWILLVALLKQDLKKLKSKDR